MASPDPVSIPKILFPNQRGFIPQLKHPDGSLTPSIKSNAPVFYTQTPSQEEESNPPQIIEAYYEYSDGSPIPDNTVKIGDEVNWVLKTKNAIGKSIAIDFDDNTKDFEYNGLPIFEDILRGIVITSDVQKLRLKIIKQ
ncbi:MAG: hypothetical protein KTR20_11475 [Cellvibrionaceae bacterium]|nr:hypothetical protein [Cellvibrionaceae bacterium]